VRIEIDEGVVVVIVEERPVIANIDFRGLKEFDKDTLVSRSRTSASAKACPSTRRWPTRRAGTQAPVPHAQPLRRRSGDHRHAAGAQPRQRDFTVTEGTAARISEIRIVGNKAFSESTLKGLFDLNDGGWLNWYTKADRYSRAKLTRPRVAARLLPESRLPRVQRRSTQVAISPDKQDITVTINVKEGQPYTVTAVKLDGDYLGKEEDFRRSSPSSRASRTAPRPWPRPPRPSSSVFGTFGYAFAKIDPRTDIDRATGQVVLTLVADPQRRVTCTASMWPATAARATKWCAANSASSNRRGTTAARSSCRVTGWTAWAISARSTSTPPKCLARSTRST